MITITVARKPLEGTVARNALTWGCGGLNIDKTRIAFEDGVNMDAVQRQGAQSAVYVGGAKPGDTIAMYKPGGRWPGNVILCTEAAKGLDEQSGIRPGMSGGGATDNRKTGREVIPSFNRKPSAPFIRGDTGGASRFFKVVSNP